MPRKNLLVVTDKVIADQLQYGLGPTWKVVGKGEALIGEHFEAVYVLLDPVQLKDWTFRSWIDNARTRLVSKDCPFVILGGRADEEDKIVRPPLTADMSPEIRAEFEKYMAGIHRYIAATGVRVLQTRVPEDWGIKPVVPDKQTPPPNDDVKPDHTV